MDISSGVIAILEDAARNKAMTLAKDARDRLEKKYRSLVTEYYGEYGDLRYYDRVDGGLLNTYERYYQNSGNYSFFGGINILLDSPVPVGCRLPGQGWGDLGERGTYAMLSWLGGYHGYPFPGKSWSNPIPSDIHPYDDMIAFRNKLIKYYEKICSAKK